MPITICQSTWRNVPKGFKLQENHFEIHPAPSLLSQPHFDPSNKYSAICLMYLKYRPVLISTWNSKILEPEYRDDKENLGFEMRHPLCVEPKLLNDKSTVKTQLYLICV
jgi:hypothetical protein